MAKIVAIHGIGQEHKNKNILHNEWLPTLNYGLQAIEADLCHPKDLECAYYSDLYFNGPIKSLGIPVHEAKDITEQWEQDLLAMWWDEAAKVDDTVASPDAQKKLLPAPVFAQDALNALCNSKFWAGVGESAFIFCLKQVYRYFHEPTLRDEIRARVVECIDPVETKIVIAHSLGTVVAYEILYKHPEWNVTTFITLGSPLGIPNLIFHQLQPVPIDEVGIWPGNVQHWTNIADQGDIVALIKKLQPLFGKDLKDILVRNQGSDAHALEPHLQAEGVAHAIADELSL